MKTHSLRQPVFREKHSRQESVPSTRLFSSELKKSGSQHEGKTTGEPPHGVDRLRTTDGLFLRGKQRDCVALRRADVPRRSRGGRETQKGPVQPGRGLHNREKIPGRGWSAPYPPFHRGPRDLVPHPERVGVPTVLYPSRYHRRDRRNYPRWLPEPHYREEYWERARQPFTRPNGEWGLKRAGRATPGKPRKIPGLPNGRSRFPTGVETVSTPVKNPVLLGYFWKR